MTEARQRLKENIQKKAEEAFIENVEKAKKEIDDIVDELCGVKGPISSLTEQLFEMRKILNRNGCSSDKLEKALANIAEIDDLVGGLSGYDSDIKYEQIKWDSKRPFGK